MNEALSHRPLLTVETPEPLSRETDAHVQHAADSSVVNEGDDSREHGEPSRLVVLLSSVAIVIAAVVGVMLWTAMRQPWALVDALGRGGLRELVMFLLAQFLARVAELARFVW